MYFKDFPQFLYDFNYGDGVVKTNIVRDITRNVRARKEILSNVSLYDEYDIVDGETPEIISEKFYGSPEYHWVIMIANEKYDWVTDFPLSEDILQKHISTTYNPELQSSDWYWSTGSEGRKTVYLRITSGEEIPFDAQYLIAPVSVSITGAITKFINWPTDFLGFNEDTQYFYFDLNTNDPLHQILKTANGVGTELLYINTTGRENNPIYFVNDLGLRVNPSVNSIPVTGDTIHRQKNDQKRRIKIISPTLLETIIKNYEELLR